MDVRKQQFLIGLREIGYRALCFSARQCTAAQCRFRAAKYGIRLWCCDLYTREHRKLDLAMAKGSPEEFRRTAQTANHLS